MRISIYARESLRYFLCIAGALSVASCNNLSSIILPIAEDIPSVTPPPTNSDPNDNGAEDLTLTWSTPPTVNSFATIDDVAYFSKDISYGTHERNTLDVLLPKTAYDNEEPAGLIMFIHSGGFVSGEKESAYEKSLLVKAALESGIALATVNYPFIGTPGSNGVIDSLNGAKRALQYLRYYHKSFRIDPSKVALAGVSAGATMALWLATHDEMAAPLSSDPIERESTRVLGVAAVETQATLDAVRWETLFSAYGITINSSTAIRDRVRAMYGLASGTDVNTVRTDPDLIAYRQKVDILAHMDASDPEIWVESDEWTDSAPPNTSHLFHHPNHPAALKERAESVGVLGTFSIPRKGVVVSPLEPMETFILRKLGVP